MSAQTRTVKAGRPLGSRTFDPLLALAFGTVMRNARLERGIAQESLAASAAVERSYLGRVERGESVPSLAVILRIAGALGCTAEQLVGATENLLSQNRRC